MSDNFRKEFHRVIYCRSSSDIAGNNKDFALKYTSRSIMMKEPGRVKKFKNENQSQLAIVKEGSAFQDGVKF